MRHISWKIGYFLLGGLVATIGYIAGSMDNIVAEQDFVQMKRLHVEERVIVGGVSDDKENYVDISAGDNTTGINIILNRPLDSPIEQSASSIFLVASKSDSIPYSGLVLRDNSPAEYKVYSFDSLPNEPSNKDVSETTYIVEVMNRQTKIIEDRLMIISADVKLPSGKKIHVEFTNPTTTGMFVIYDKIRIRQKGNKWEFIEHIP